MNKTRRVPQNTVSSYKEHALKIIWGSDKIFKNINKAIVQTMIRTA